MLLRSPDARDGLRDIAPVMVAAIPIALLFGAVAAAKGLSVAEVALMSTLVFAGGAQFAAIEMWSYPVPVAAILFSTLLVNARHVLMGASLAPKTRGFSGPQRYLGFFFLTDEAWALAERRALQRTVTPAYWFACAAVLPAAWIGSSVLGTAVGALLGDPKTFGADFAFTALFIGLVAGFNKGRITVATVAASGATAALVHVTAGPPWHVLAGALAGIAAAYLAAPSSPLAEDA
ncbi:MAG TPA: AzlC family ABC transporter permease [Beijerinckiaceae bacterium]|jgi:4-azaleucine resistance transporter AzlC